MEALSDVVFKTKYEPYEFKDVKKSVNFERGAAEAIPEIIALDTAHTVAFRHGLGNSLFANAAAKVTSSEHVKEFSKKVFTAPNITIIGTSVNHGELVSLTDKLFEKVSHTVPSTPIASKYFGGESRIATAGSNHFVLGFEGAPLGTRDYAILQVLRAHLDGEKRVKWGVGVTRLAQMTDKLKVQISPFNAGYSDAGLFGIYISGKPTSIYEAARAVAEQLKHAARGISSEEWKLAVQKAKYNTAAFYETRASQTELLGGQVIMVLITYYFICISYLLTFSKHYYLKILYSGRIIPVSEIIDEVASVNINEINDV